MSNCLHQVDLWTHVWGTSLIILIDLRKSYSLWVVPFHGQVVWNCSRKQAGKGRLSRRAVSVPSWCLSPFSRLYFLPWFPQRWIVTWIVSQINVFSPRCYRSVCSVIATVQLEQTVGYIFSITHPYTLCDMLLLLVIAIYPKISSKTNIYNIFLDKKWLHLINTIRC